MLNIDCAQIEKTIKDKYPASKPCSCDICLSYCARPGWWTVEEASQVIQVGLAARMMLEISPEQTFGVLSSAFKGCESFFALNEYARNGCTFLTNDRCELHGTELMPLECAFCHHEHTGLRLKCHSDLETEWNTPVAQKLVVSWMKITGLWKDRYLTRVNWME